MRPIDADALKHDFCAMKFPTDRIDVIELIDKQPKIDADPVRHGFWKGWTRSCFTGKYKDYDEPEFKDYKYYQCSECYRKSAIKELYCPSCGAKMDKE